MIPLRPPPPFFGTFPKINPISYQMVAPPFPYSNLINMKWRLKINDKWYKSSLHILLTFNRSDVKTGAKKLAKTGWIVVLELILYRTQGILDSAQFPKNAFGPLGIISHFTVV